MQEFLDWILKQVPAVGALPPLLPPSPPNTTLWQNAGGPKTWGVSLLPPRQPKDAIPPAPLVGTGLSWVRFAAADPALPNNVDKDCRAVRFGKLSISIIDSDPEVPKVPSPSKTHEARRLLENIQWGDVLPLTGEVRPGKEVSDIRFFMGKPQC